MTFNSSGDWTLPSVVVMGCWLTIIILIGVFGNILVIIVSVQGTRVRTRGKSLIVSMAVADMLESLNMVFMLVTVASYGEWVFRDVMCQLHAFINTQFVITSMYSLMTISINRYFMVVKTNLYKKVFSTKNLGFMVALIWLFPLIFAIPPLFGWSQYDFQPNKATCIVYFSTSVMYSIILMAFVIPVPLGIIIFCCYKIFNQVRRHRTRIQGISSSRGAVNVEEIHITKTLIIIILAYLICFILAAIVNLIEMISPSYRINFWVDIITCNLVFANHANNPIIYGLFNKQYRKAFRGLIFKAFPRVKYSSNDDSTIDGQNNAPQV